MTAEVPGSGRVIARNAALNAAGMLLPLLLALPVLPFVLRSLGPDRFAVLALAWTVIGYFGFLDLGLGRAATQLVAGLLGENRRGEVSRVVWSSLAIQTMLGIAGAALIAALAPILARDVLRIADPLLLAETRTALMFVALGLPLVLLSGTFSGVLEAHQRFDLMNLVRVPANLATLAVPAVGVQLGASLPAIILGIVAARACALLCFAVLASRVAGRLRPEPPHWPTLRTLLGFGGWLTVSLLAVPILTYAERLLIGGLRSLAELAYYTVPFEIVARTAVIPSAIAMTLFPAFSYARNDGRRIDELFRRPLRLLFLFQWPLLVVLWLFAAELLTVWMGAAVAAAGATVLRLLALAFFLNSFSQIALAGVQGLGRPDLKAKLDLIEVPLFILLAVLLIPRYGIAGAAAAKLIITALDTTVLFAYANRLAGRPLLDLAKPRRHPALAALTLLLIGSVAASAGAPMAQRLIVTAAAVFALGGGVWRWSLDAADRAAVRSMLTRFLPMKEATP
jgi:O-antigen/teichoic acid export membrane protein